MGLMGAMGMARSMRLQTANLIQPGVSQPCARSGE
jgi:hypothetical protein